MDKQNKKEITRRRFLKTLGIGAGVTTAALYGCGDKVQSTGEPGKETSPVPLGKMTYRENPKTKEKVSLLGYGCMRLPTKKVSDDKEEIDQEMVNRQVETILTLPPPIAKASRSGPWASP